MFLVEISGWGVASIVIGCVVVAFLAGFFLCRWYANKQIRENPPINEKMIRAMYLSMGRKPSEAQINATMRAMREAGAKENQKKKKKSGKQ